MRATIFIFIAAMTLNAGGAIVRESSPWRVNFKQDCATRRGQAGEGAGPMAEALTVSALVHQAVFRGEADPAGTEAASVIGRGRILSMTHSLEATQK